MQNNVAGAKLEESPNSCTIDEVLMLEDVTNFWTVDEDGDALEFDSSTDQGDFVSYDCSGCGESFDNWDDCKEHLV